MTVIGEKAAVVSLGLSCQTATQIKMNVDLLKELTGDASLRPRGGLFDSMLCAPDAVARLLAARSFFPERHELALAPRPYWKKHNVFFWHDFRDDREADTYDIDAAYATAGDKFRHKTGTFQALRGLERLIVVVSNTQNNLAQSAAEFGVFGHVISTADLDAIKREADDFFQRDVEIIALTYEDRLAVARETGMNVYKLTPDRTRWRGSQEQWSGVFRDYFGRRPRP